MRFSEALTGEIVSQYKRVLERRGLGDVDDYAEALNSLLSGKYDTATITPIDWNLFEELEERRSTGGRKGNLARLTPYLIKMAEVSGRLNGINPHNYDEGLRKLTDLDALELYEYPGKLKIGNSPGVGKNSKSLLEKYLAIKGLVSPKKIIVSQEE